MIHRRTMLEDPHIAPDGTLCYFLSSTTLADFDPFNLDAEYSAWVMESDSDFMIDVGVPWSLGLLLEWAVEKRPGDDLILWPTDEERYMRSLYAERDRMRLAAYEEMGVNVDSRLP